MGRPPTISRDQLLATARTLFARKGYDATRLADIADELGVTPAALLRHARSKEELFALAMSTNESVVPQFFLDLENVDPAADPREVLMNLAQQYVPFAHKRIEATLAVYMRSKTAGIPLPIFPENDSPPARAIALVEHYFKRAARAGTIRLKDPRAAALLFMGSLFSYMFFHHVFRITPAQPLDRYLASLFDLWADGAIVTTRKKPGVKRARSK